MKGRSTGIVLLALILSAAAAIAAVLHPAWQHGRVTLTLNEYDELRRYAAIGEVMELIEGEYYAAPPDEEALMAAAAKGMALSLGDPYAGYYTDREYESYIAGVNGDYFGLGMRLQKREGERVEVTDVYPGSPAERAGMMVGDIITHIGAEDTAALTLEEVQQLIEQGKSRGVEFGVSRGKREFTVRAAGGSVRSRQVSFSMMEGGIGYIAVSMFTGGCAEEFKAALDELRADGMRALAIDLRDDPGGALDTALAIADELLGEGMRIVSIGRENADDGEVYEAGGEPFGEPLAVLVNGSSASASEILAAAVQQNGVGAVVGERTFGKGVVQTTMYVEGLGGWLKLTTDRYFTPDGGCIHGVGIEPDIPVRPHDRYAGVPAASIPVEEDAQLKAALEYLRQCIG